MRQVSAAIGRTKRLFGWRQRIDDPDQPHGLLWGEIVELFGEASSGDKAARFFIRFSGELAAHICKPRGGAPRPSR